VERKGLATHNNYFTQDIVTGVVGGAAVGAATGALTAWMTGEKVGQAALIGAGVGAVAGGMAGYYSALQSREGQSPSGFFGSLIKNADEEQQRVLAMQDSLDQLLACRQKEESEIRTAYKLRRIDRITGEQRLAKLRQRVQDDMLVANEIRKGLGEHMDGLQFAALKAAPGQVRYVSMDETDEAVSEEPVVQKPHKGKKKKITRKSISKKGRVHIPAKVNEELAKAPDAPEAKTIEEKTLQRRVAQSISQVQDGALKLSNTTNNLGKVASRPLDDGLEKATS